MFHVEHSIASVATGSLLTGMTEYEHVGHEVAKHSQTEDASKNLFFGISEVQQLAPKEQTCDSECRDREFAHWHDRT